MMSARGEPIALEQYFASSGEHSRELFDVVRAVIESMGQATIRVTRSQVAFRRRRAFAWTWMPGQYLRGNVAPLVLTIELNHRDGSPRWKEIVEPRPGRFAHHLELRSAAEVDEEVLRWLREAWEQAG